MKLLLMFLFFMPLLIGAQESNNLGIRWTEGLTWKEVLAKAKIENKYIFVDCYASWCIPCKKMDKEIYPNKEVGEMINPYFISIKVQMDVTPNDNEQVKAWYDDARLLKEQYKPEGYPCFLFFSPQGILVHRFIGLLSLASFSKLVRDALTNPIGTYQNRIASYKQGQLRFEDMPSLAKEAKKSKNRIIANEIAKTYKEHYLDKLPDSVAFTKENLLFLAEFGYNLITTSDRYFNFFYHYGNKADKIMDYLILGKLNKISDRIVTGIIKKEKITEKLYHDGYMVKNPRPNWQSIKITIKKEYGKSYVNRFFPNVQIDYYFRSGDWKHYVRFINQKIKKFPPSFEGHTFGGQFGDSYALNNYAWDLFENCDNKRLLRKAISWVDMAIHFTNSDFSKVECIDTKANLLYKLGRRREAIQLMKNAVKVQNVTIKIKENLEKMEKGLPTWLVTDEKKNQKK